MIVYDDRMKIFQSTLLQDKNYISGFGSRLSGDGRQSSTLVNFFERFNLPYKSVVIPEQIHSANVEEVGLKEDKIQNISTTDGLVSSAENVMLSIITGDCVPIIFTDISNGVIGISHQGWRGSLKKLPIRVVT